MYRLTVSQDSAELDTSSRASNDGDDQRRTTTLQQNYPDSQQIFVGNLPQFLSDKDIREFFSRKFML
jgi:RNA recognition motif-containing protein